MAKNEKERKLILVTNDDGIQAPGLRILAEHLSDLGEVYMVAPDREQSAVGHSLTLHHPLRINEVGPRMIAVEGTPTDCVLLARYRLLPQKPSLVFSGINYGHNLGDDITYSGTVSAAFEATLLGIPSVAISIERDGKKIYYDVAAKFAKKIAQKVLKEGLPKDTFLNVNLPNVPASKIRGVVVTKQGRRSYDDVIVAKVDPRGRPYFWIGNGEPRWEQASGTDIQAVRENKISITPIHLDLTNHRAIEKLKDWKIRV
ncbi:MAG: 5'/3'-nucleotidase SurE [Candidatus Abyssobacteria bacterium SURF_17]|uniref:5'-nucleotidase SurE n=1 Tax=Candidatus Abyssobacteria bacterium SURF_17 TaxID=2093361 RepID=A0A419EXN6_9BACT|nr:MAG: 5'/3'-nucleotidase SurE [Candidatus Abyssubacteria bacterium SURF_17]